MTGYESKKKAALDEDGMYLVHQTKYSDIVSDGGLDPRNKFDAQPAQEPVAWMSSDKAWMWSDYSKALAAVAHNPRLTLIPLYTAPPQRTWVDLTDDDCKGMSAGDMLVAMWVSRILKEKNT